LTKASLYVYFGPVAALVCRRFDLSPDKHGTFRSRALERTSCTAERTAWHPEYDANATYRYLGLRIALR